MLFKNTLGPRLNESPSEKEGKSISHVHFCRLLQASMKALPKRKGNLLPLTLLSPFQKASMKALPKRKGNECARDGEP